PAHSDPSTLSLHDALPIWCRSPNTPVSDRNLNFAFLHTWLHKQHVIASFERLFLRRKVPSLMVPNTKGPETRTDWDRRSSFGSRSEEHTSELQSRRELVCR